MIRHHEVSVNGRTFTRNSLTRNYTHAIIVYREARTARPIATCFSSWSGSEKAAYATKARWERRGCLATVATTGCVELDTRLPDLTEVVLDVG